MSSVFICYRRSDSQGFAGRLSDDLTERLGASKVFRDDEIKAGNDYTEVLRHSVARCSVLLVVIGKQWLLAQAADGSRRLDDPDDWVRIEVESGLERDMLVIPVLVGGVQIPKATELPESLRSLAHRQAFAMSDRNWEKDLESLIDVLGDYDPGLRPQPSEAHTGTARNFSLFRRRTKLTFLKVWVKKTLVTMFLLLLGYFIFENYVEPDTRAAIRQFVSDFVVFVIDAGQSLLRKIEAL